MNIRTDCQACDRHRCGLLAALNWLWFAVLFSIVGHESFVSASTPNLRFRHISTEQGLSSGVVYSIVQDQKGFMWFGTQVGLDCHDGYQFKVFLHDPNDVNSLSDTNVSALVDDGCGRLWIGTWGGGLDCYTYSTKTFTHYRHRPGDPKSLSGNRVQCVYADQKGFIWVGTFASGLNRLDPKSGNVTRISLNSIHKDSQERIWAVCEDDRGFLWIGTDDGLDRIDPDHLRITHFKSEPTNSASLSHDVVKAIAHGKDGLLWLGTGRGVTRLDTQTLGMKRFFLNDAGRAPDEMNHVRCLLQDLEGIVWVGSYGGGLVRLDPESGHCVNFRNLENDPFGLSFNRIECLYEDSGGVLWIATSGGGVNAVDLHPKRFDEIRVHTGHPGSLSSNDVSCVMQGNHGDLWIGTYGLGLNHLDRTSGVNRIYENASDDSGSLSDNTIRALLTDRFGDVWVGTYRGGLNLLNKNHDGFVCYRHDPTNPRSLANDCIRALYEDSAGNLWIGTDAGVDRFDRKEGGFYHAFRGGSRNTQSALSHPRVLDMLEDDAGDFWVGTEHGLNRIQGPSGGLQVFQNQADSSDSLSHNRVFVLHEDPERNIWIGTNLGLNRFLRESETFERHLMSKTQATSVILGVLSDDDGNLWLSSPAGILKYDPIRRRARHYDVNDGLRGSCFNQGAFHRNKNGELFFGGTHGVSCFFPKQIVENPHVPPIAITGFKVLNDAIDIPIHELKRVTLSPRQNVFSLEFAALDFAFPAKNRYAYRLEGFDDDWIEAGHRRFVNYTNLPPGDYTFWVKGSNCDGIWNQKGARLGILVTPPFWKTNWFLGVCLCVILAVVSSRSWMVRKNTRLLESRVAARTSSLKQANEDLKQTASDLQDTQQQLVQAAHQAGMAEIATGVLHNIGNLLNSINISSQKIDVILRRSKIGGLKKANDFLRGHEADLVGHVATHPKAEYLLQYYLKLERVLLEERRQVLAEVRELIQKISLVTDVIATQQDYARIPEQIEEVDLRRLLDDAFKLEQAALEKHGIQVRRKNGEVPLCHFQRSKLMQVFINLIRNAMEALDDDSVSDAPTILTVEMKVEDPSAVTISFSDTGCGIAPENSDIIFSYGFTTKLYGHGFGLHSTANTVNELGGTIRATSPGINRGSTLTVTLPIVPV